MLRLVVLPFGFVFVCLEDRIERGRDVNVSNVIRGLEFTRTH